MADVSVNKEFLRNVFIALTRERKREILIEQRFDGYVSICPNDNHYFSSYRVINDSDIVDVTRTAVLSRGQKKDESVREREREISEDTKIIAIRLQSNVISIGDQRQ